jgi:transglutaminase-like putative cysteine protease
MPVFTIHHITKYEYDRPIKESVNEIRIYPFVDPTQETLHHELNITGQPEVLLMQDYWGNQAGMFNLIPSHKEMVIESKLILRTVNSSTLLLNQETSLDLLRKETANSLLLWELSTINEPGLKQPISELLNDFYKSNMTVASIIEKCGDYIFNNFQYIKGITNIETTVAEILEHRSGVCQDFAHVMLEMLRSLGIPSRYVSGYICPNKNGMRGEGATHAWIEAWIPGNGWVGNDPTNNVWVTNHHVKLAVGRHFNDCTPVKGTFKGVARQSLSVYVSIGYEDGQTIEEINEVKLEAPTGIDESTGDIDILAGRQQQQ